MWYVRDVLYAVLYVCVSCFVVRGCGVSRRYIDNSLSFIKFVCHDRACLSCTLPKFSQL